VIIVFVRVHDRPLLDRAQLHPLVDPRRIASPSSPGAEIAPRAGVTR